MKEKDQAAVIARARKRFAEAQEFFSEIREDALEDLRFRLGDQWPEVIRQEREADGQSCLTINRVPAFVRQVVNEMRQMRPQIKVRAVDSAADPKTAEIINGLIRVIEADSAADSAYDWGGEYAVTCGFGFWRITTEYEHERSFDQVIRIDRIRNPMACYLDHHADNQDGSDARWGIVVDQISKEEFAEKYPKAKGKWDLTDHDWYNDQDGVRIAEYWEVEEEQVTLYQLATGEVVDELPEGITVDTIIETPDGFMPLIVNQRQSTEREVKQYILTGSEVLEEHEWAGKYIPIVQVLGEEIVVDGELELRGMVRDMRDPQRMYNYSRSQYVDRVSLAPKMPYMGARGAFQDPRWGRINVANLPYIEYEPVPGEPPPQRQMGPDASPGLIAEMQMTAEELKAVSGIYNAGLGDRSNEVAGVAIDARKLESDVGTFHYLDNLAKSIRYTGKILVDLIPKIYSGARAMRIMKEDGEEEEIRINAPYMDPKTGRETAYILDAGRYDVSVDVGPSYTTQRQEAVSSMLEIAKAFPASVQVMGDLIAKNMDWPEADTIAKRLKLLLPPEILQEEFPVIGQMQKQMAQVQEQAQTMMQAMQHQIAQLQMELQNRDKDNAIKAADLQRKALADQQSHIEGMTKLELEAQRNLNPAGVAYG